MSAIVLKNASEHRAAFRSIDRVFALRRAERFALIARALKLADDAFFNAPSTLTAQRPGFMALGTAETNVFVARSLFVAGVRASGSRESVCA